VIVPLVALLLVAILGVAAMAIDGGMLLAERRSVQATADASALAAAMDLFQNFDVNHGVDARGTAATSAQSVAMDNGFTNGTNNVTVTVNIPPASGTYKSVLGFVEVIITMQQTGYFSNVFGSGNVVVAARAVARGSKAPRGNGLIVLAPQGSNQLTSTASGPLNVIGGNIIVDSANAEGATITNSGNIAADAIYLTGNPGYGTSSNGQFVGTISSDQAPAPDPLAALAPPPAPSAFYNNVSISTLPTVGGSVPGYPTPGDSNGWTLPPGTYNNGIHISDNNSAHTYTLDTGIFYFIGGGFTLSSNASIKSDPMGNLLYFRSNGGLSITSGGAVNLAPLTSGPYANITVYQDRTNNSADSIIAQATGSLNVTGTVYLPAAKLTVTGSGGTYALGTQYIVYQLSVTGSGTFNLNYAAGNPPPDRDLYLVE
jgi:hypothetical protein